MTTQQQLTEYVARYCAEAIRLYREYVERHEASPEDAEAKAMQEVREALEFDESH